MSFLAKNPDVWARNQPDDYPDEPAPFVAHYKRLPASVAWALDIRDQENLACGECRTLEEAQQACHEAAERLGLRRTWDGWVSPPDEAYLT